jgi:hypothetical protein
LCLLLSTGLPVSSFRRPPRPAPWLSPRRRLPAPLPFLRQLRLGLSPSPRQPGFSRVLLIFYLFFDFIGFRLKFGLLGRKLFLVLVFLGVELVHQFFFLSLRQSVYLRLELGLVFRNLFAGYLLRRSDSIPSMLEVTDIFRFPVVPVMATFTSIVLIPAHISVRAF